MRISEKAQKILKILIIVVVILIVLLFIAALILEVPRYRWLKRKGTIEYLDRRFQQRQKQSLDKISNRKDDGHKKSRLIWSFSTIPDRIHLMRPTLASALDQTLLPDEICINIPMLSRKGKEYVIPKWLDRLKSVKIYRVDVDEGPATKLLPTLRREKHDPDTRIVCGDDDNVYHPKTLEILNQTYKKYKRRGELVAVTNYGVSLDEDEELPGIPERVRTVFTGERETDLLQGFSGFLVTPRMMPEEAYDIKTGPKEAISVDDVWFSGWLNINRIPIITPAYIFLHLPILDFGKMRKTPALAHGENKNFVSDMKVIRWFIDDMGMVPVCSRSH